MKLSSTSNTVTPKRTDKGVYLSRIFLEFFLKSVYPNMVVKSFKCLVLRLLETKFLLMSLCKSLPQAEGNYQFPANRVFWKSIFTQHKGGRVMELKKRQKLNLWGYWLQVLINSTIFTIFIHFLVSVLLCHNLDLSMLKCEGSLTFSLKII